MSILWAEPFDQYGNTYNITTVQSMGYSTVSGTPQVITGAAARTGISWRMFGTNGLLRRTFDTAITSGGMGCGFNQSIGGTFNSLLNSGMAFESAPGTVEVLVKYNSNNGYDVYDRTGTLKGSTPNNVSPQGVWQWIEFRADGNSAGVNTGKVEVRVNGVTQCVVNGINLPNAFVLGRLGGNGNMDANLDDWIIWDTSGPAPCNNFLGDRRLAWSVPNAGTALADFTANPAGSPFDRINDAPPTGAPTDTAWIEGAAAGNISEFTGTGLNIASNDIAAIVLVGRLAKSDAGTCTGRIGINSNGNVLNSADINPGTSFGWTIAVVPLDPNGNIPWTKAAVDLANRRITRTV